MRKVCDVGEEWERSGLGSTEPHLIRNGSPLPKSAKSADSSTGSFVVVFPETLAAHMCSSRCAGCL